MTSLLTVEELMDVVDTTLDEPALQAIIDREEAWLARRIGPLADERTVTYYVWPTDLDDPLWLSRPTDEVAVTDGGTELDESVVRLLGNGTIVERADASWVGPTVEIASEPNDGLEVKGGVIELVRLTLTESGYQSERIGDYSYSRGPGSTMAAREAIAYALLPHRGSGTVRLRSSLRPARIGQVAP